MGVPLNGWFIREHPIKMDDLGIPPFVETPIYSFTYIYTYYTYICECTYRKDTINKIDRSDD